MKANLLLAIFIFPVVFSLKPENIKSRVYSFSDAKVEKTATGEKRPMMDGETTHMRSFEIHTTMLEPGKMPHGSQVHADSEEIVFVKEGSLKVTINNESKVLGGGSLALILPGDEHGLENAGIGNTTYYIIRYQSKKPQDNQRGKDGGGSVFVDWNDLKFTPHDKGGIRRFFDRKSSMSDRIEIHATTLNPGIKSHEPHTHNPEEIILMMSGTTEMEIGGKIYSGNTGDIYFLGSEIPHAIRNTGSEPCSYLAFQWQ